MTQLGFTTRQAGTQYGTNSKWLLFSHWLPFPKTHIKTMPRGCPITQIWVKLRGIPQIWVNPQIWVIPESDHLELREITLGSPRIGRIAYFWGWPSTCLYVLTSFVNNYSSSQMAQLILSSQNTLTAQFYIEMFDCQTCFEGITIFHGYKLDLFKVIFFQNTHNRHPGPLLLTWINFNSTWISNHILSKLWDEITYPFPNFNRVSEWISYSTTYFIMDVNTYPCWD